MSTDKVVLVLGKQVSPPMDRALANEALDELRRNGLYAQVRDYQPQVSDHVVPIGNHDPRYDGWQSTRNTSRYGKEV